jgi:hypothetical protein
VRDFRLGERRGRVHPGLLRAIPGPANSVQGHLVEVDKKAHDRAPEKQAYHELLSTNSGTDDPNPDSHAQGYGQTNAEWSHLIDYRLRKGESTPDRHRGGVKARSDVLGAVTGEGLYDACDEGATKR